MKKLKEFLHAKIFLILLQITGLMPLVVGNVDKRSLSKQSGLSPLQSNIFASLSLEERRYLDHFRQTSSDLLQSRIRRTPLHKHLTLHFEDLPGWRVKRSEAHPPLKESSSPGILSKVIEPSSFGLTQTDREYFNIVRTENGMSDFFKFLPKKKNEGTLQIHKNKSVAKHRPKFIYHRVPGSVIPPFSGQVHQSSYKATKDVAAVSLAKAFSPKRIKK